MNRQQTLGPSKDAGTGTRSKNLSLFHLPVLEHPETDIIQYRAIRLKVSLKLPHRKALSGTLIPADSISVSLLEKLAIIFSISAYIFTPRAF
jgi:hypothetical protein